MKISLLLKQSRGCLGVEAEGGMDCMDARETGMMKIHCILITVLISQVNSLIKDRQIAPLIVCKLFCIKQ